MTDVSKILAMLRLKGVIIDAQTRILDLGCGEGRAVYELMDLGYRETYGHDVEDRVVLRHPDDKAHFRFSAAGESWPFPDDFFDVIYSETVLEHVQDHHGLFTELHRVLKPGGTSIHTFPSKWTPIEPHIKVPLASLFQSHAYFRFWAMLGVRNEFQKGLSANEVADLNTGYAKSALNYLSQPEYEDRLRPIFGNRFKWDELVFIWSKQWGPDSPQRWRRWSLRNLVRRLLFSELLCDLFPPSIALYRALKMRTLVVWKGDVTCQFKRVREQASFSSVHPHAPPAEQAGP